MTAPASEADGEAVRSALGVRAGMRIWVGGHAIEARRAIERHLSGTTRPPRGPLDAAFICPKTPDEATYFAEKVRPRLEAAATIWVVEPIPQDNPVLEAQAIAIDKQFQACRK